MVTDYTLDNLCADTPMDVAKKISAMCYMEIPVEISSVEDMTKAGSLLGIITNRYSYLMSLTILVKAFIKVYEKTDRKLWLEMLTKKETLDDACQTTLQQYQAVSRMIATKQEINKEINMY